MTHIDIAGIAPEQVIAFRQQNIHEQDDEKSIQIGHIENRKYEKKHQHKPQNDTIHMDPPKHSRFKKVSVAALFPKKPLWPNQ